MRLEHYIIPRKYDSLGRTSQSGGSVRISSQKLTIPPKQNPKQQQQIRKKKPQKLHSAGNQVGSKIN